MTPAGSANGELALSAVLADATARAKEAVKALGHKAPSTRVPEASEAGENAVEPVWLMPQGAGDKLRMKTWLDFQNDVKVSDVQLAAREGMKALNIPNVIQHWVWQRIRVNCRISMAWQRLLMH